MHAPENAEAIEGCLSAACRGVRVEIGEIWRRESKAQSRYSPVHVFASEETVETFSRVLAGSEADRTRKHKLSPQVRFQPSCWWWGGWMGCCLLAVPHVMPYGAACPASLSLSLCPALVLVGETSRGLWIVMMVV